MNRLCRIERFRWQGQDYETRVICQDNGRHTAETTLRPGDRIITDGLVLLNLDEILTKSARLMVSSCVNVFTKMGLFSEIQSKIMPSRKPFSSMLFIGAIFICSIAVFHLCFDLHLLFSLLSVSNTLLNLSQYSN